LLGVSYVTDIGIIALLLLFIVPMSDRGPWTTVAGWLGAGGAGLAWVAFLDLVAARKETAEMRDYYRSVLIMVALAIVAMTGIGCAFIPFAHRWISNLAGASFVFVTLCACIYRKPAPKAVPGLP
jgi:hypothetical protein